LAKKKFCTKVKIKKKTVIGQGKKKSRHNARDNISSQKATSLASKKNSGRGEERLALRNIVGTLQTGRSRQKGGDQDRGEEGLLIQT